MKKFKMFLIFIGIATSAGIMYALSTLRGIPDAFDWEDDEDF